MSDEPIDERGPYTCCRCTEPTWNDDDWCDECVAEAAKENERIEAAFRPALSPPAEGEVSVSEAAKAQIVGWESVRGFDMPVATHATPTPAPVDWERVGPKLVKAAKTARLAISGRINEYTAPQSDLWSALLQIDAALAAAQPEGR